MCPILVIQNPKRRYILKHCTILLLPSVQESQEVSPFQTGYHKAARNRHHGRQRQTQITRSIHKRSTEPDRPVKKLLKGIN